MSLFDDVKVAVRISSTNTATDSEINLWIDSAVADMKRVGIDPTLLGETDDTKIDPLVKAAITCYVKANYGYDNSERSQFGSSYRGIVASLLNSRANLAAAEDGEQDA